MAQSSQQVSVRANSVPTGGAAATTEATQTVALLPDTPTLKALSAQFMEHSEANCLVMNSQPLTAGQQTIFTVQNVGLGQGLELLINANIHIVGTAAGSVNLSPEFPFNLIQNLMVQFNGQTVLDSLSGYELLTMNAKRYKSVYRQNPAIQTTGMNVGFNGIMQPVVPQVVATFGTLPSNITVTKGNGLLGIATIAWSAAATYDVPVRFVVRVPFTLRDDLLLGLLPMQNNSVNLNVGITVPTIYGATPASPTYTVSGGTVTLGTASVTPTYNFWSIPSPNNAALYSYLISHSYMLLSQQNLTCNAVGADALQYSLPNNYYLLGLLLTLRDSTGALLDPHSALGMSYLNYNGTARVDRRDIVTKLARQFMYYEGYPTGMGQLLWDATDIDFQSNSVNTSKWLNMYLANNPMFVADIASGISVPVSYSVVREQLVPANIQLV